LITWWLERVYYFPDRTWRLCSSLHCKKWVGGTRAHTSHSKQGSIEYCKKEDNMLAVELFL
jgi:hypothetical protein